MRINEFRGISVLFTVLLLLSSQVAGLDLSTGTPVTPGEYKPLPEGRLNTQILWDLTHGVYLGYEPSNRFSALTSTLAIDDFDMNTTSAGIDNIDLTQYQVVVLAVLSSWDSAYDAAEVAALNSYLAQGGGLLILTENSGCPNGNLALVCSEYGVTAGLSHGESSDIYFTNFTTHRIFDGITTIYYRAAGALSCTSPSTEQAWSPTSSSVMVTLAEPDPRVIVLSDGNVFTNDYYGQADNMFFSLNLFHFLAGHGVALERSTWGAIKAALQ